MFATSVGSSFEGSLIHNCPKLKLWPFERVGSVFMKDQNNSPSSNCFNSASNSNNCLVFSLISSFLALISIFIELIFSSKTLS